MESISHLSPWTSKLLGRLDEIGLSLSRTNSSLALIGLGSCGVELERLDEFSDLDFFAIVSPGSKVAYLEDLSWLTTCGPIAYAFRNTADGYKVLYEDGIFCEFAVFTPEELMSAVFAPGRVVWRREAFDTSLARPQKPLPSREERSLEWILGEALTNLYVGLGRFHRGEKLSAFRFVQSHAVDRAVELLLRSGLPGTSPAADPFSSERRLESRSAGVADLLETFMQGYSRTPESALAILGFLRERYPVNTAMEREIRRLAHPVSR